MTQINCGLTELNALEWPPLRVGLAPSLTELNVLEWPPLRVGLAPSLTELNLLDLAITGPARFFLFFFNFGFQQLVFQQEGPPGGPPAESDESWQ